VTPSGIEPATFWLVAQYLNQKINTGTEGKRLQKRSPLQNQYAENSSVIIPKKI
jgi:hypothetical protein